MTTFWDYSTVPVPKIYDDLENNYMVYLKGKEFPEYEVRNVFSLGNNTTDSLSIADKTYNRSIEIKYTITRGTAYRSGTLKILNTGTALLFDPGDYIQTMDLGVTFNGAYYSGHSNTIKLKWTTTNTGNAATISYDAFRQNY